MAKMTNLFSFDEDEEPIAAEPMYFCSDESESSTSNSTPDSYLESVYLDFYNTINQIKTF